MELLSRRIVEVDGVPVDREQFPASPEELSEILRCAAASGISVVPVGGGTKLMLGNPPRSAGAAVFTTRLRGITEYEPDNMTVSARAGTPLCEVQQELKKNNQFLPLDPPRPAEATLGGLVACNTSGPIRLRYGTIRDLLLGVKIAHADGTRTKAGGKLVKNVTGYDMCRLYTGSLGTLGILYELTFKVQPQPEALSTVVLSYPSAESAFEATQVFLRSDLLPDAVEVWNAEAFEQLSGEAIPRSWVLMARFGEVAPAVEWQVGRLKEMLPSTGGQLQRVLDTGTSESWWEMAASAREIPDQGEAVILKCSILHRSATETVHQVEEAGDRLAACTSIFCHAGSHVIYARYKWKPAGPPAETLRDELNTIRKACTRHGGHMVVEKVRPEVKAGFDVWGYDAPALKIMRRIKQEFDPGAVLNPGRFVGGI